MATRATFSVTFGLILLCSAARAQETDFRSWEDFPGLYFYLLQPAESWEGGVLSVEWRPVRDHVSGAHALRLDFLPSPAAPGLALYRPNGPAAASRAGYAGLGFWVKGDGSPGVGVIGIGEGRPNDPRASFLLRGKTWQPVRVRWTDFDMPVATPGIPSLFFSVTSETKRPASYIVDQIELVRAVGPATDDAGVAEEGAKAAKLPEIAGPVDLSTFVTRREKLERTRALVAAKKPMRVLVVGDAVAQGGGLWNVPAGVRGGCLFWGALEAELKRRGVDATVTPVFVENAVEGASRMDVMLARTKADLAVIELSATPIGRDSTVLGVTLREADRAMFESCRRAGAEVLAGGVAVLPDRFKRADEAGLLLEEAGRAGASSADFGRLSAARGRGFEGEFYATPDQLNCQGHLLLAKLLLSAVSNP